MRLTRVALFNPIAVVVAALLISIFGLISLSQMPIQLTPSVEQPQISVSTNWRAAAPEEIEEAIIEPQEEVLRSLPGMVELQASASAGRGSITITFQTNTDLTRALLEVISRLNQVSRYPEDADEPVISSTGSNSSAIAWFIIKPLPGNDNDIASYQDFLEDVVQTRFERVPGVARSEVRGGRTKEVQIVFDPYKAASLGVELPKAAQLAGGGEDTSGGFIDVGRRKYTLRFDGAYSLSELRDLVIEWRDGRPVRLQDVAEISLTEAERSSFVIQNGGPAMAMNAYRETGVNVLEVMAGLREAVDELKEGPLKRAGLSLRQVYDETVYIDNSIALVSNNMLLGVILAIGVLWWFLRKFRATMMVALAIPLSLVITFILLQASGRTINVISLAGLAFAVGMVLDAAIVVLENIVRLREQKHPDAADKGTEEVWGALLASTATTVAIFLPIVFLKEEAGQLFADLAIAISGAVIASLLIAITVLPAAAKSWLQHVELEDRHSHWWDNTANVIMRLTNTAKKRWSWILVLITVSPLLIFLLKPEADYLPEGSRNLIFAPILAPPGATIDMMDREIGQVVAKRMQPYVDEEKEPFITHYFFVGYSGGMFMGARATDPEKTEEVIGVMRMALGGHPDTLAFPRRTSLFQRARASRAIEIDIQGGDIESLLEAALIGYQEIPKVLPGVRVRALTGLELAEPEVKLITNEQRIAEVGWDRGDMAGIIRAIGDGLFVGDYFDGEQRLDILLKSKQWDTPEELAMLPLETPEAGVVPLQELVTIVRTAGPNTIRRINRRRTITLQVQLPSGITPEYAITQLKQQVEPLLNERLPLDGHVSYAGTADKLQTALASMLGSFALAIVILYLLISALFRSFKDSLLVVLVLPLATVGGVLGLQFLNLFTFQPMDLLTMIGFIIMLGLVVNNAILLVHRTRQEERKGMERVAAVHHAVRLRLRPILMSTLTSIFGMLPLLLMPGSGSELYRGLAAVIVSGMALSTLFTLVLLPSLLQLGKAKHQESVS